MASESITVTLGGGTEQEIIVRLNELAKGRDGYDATVGGTNGQVQYNSGDEFAGSAGMTYDEGSETFTATNIAGTNGTFTDAAISLGLTAGTVTATTGSFTDASVTGTLTAAHIHGNLAGSLYTHIRAGENLSKGDPVYISGYHAGTDRPIVMRADSANSATMPSIGIMDAATALNGSGHVVISGIITDLNTNAYSVNQNLYVASGGGLTGTRPSANAQPVAIVERVNTNNGAIIVTPSTTFSNISISASQIGDSTTVGRSLLTTANPGAIRFVRINADNTATLRAASDFRADIGVVEPSSLSITTSQISDATTIGRSLMTLVNPGAIRFPRFNADNTTSSRTAAELLSDISAVGLSGDQTVAGNKTLSGQLELTGQAATNATSAMTRSLGDTRYGLKPTSLVLSADTNSDTNTTTYKTITELQATLDVGTYLIEALLNHSGNANFATSGVKDRIHVVSGSATANGVVFRALDNATASSTFPSGRVSANPLVESAPTNRSQSTFRRGTLTVTSQAVIAVQIAQTTAVAASNTTLLQGSYLTITPL